MKISDFKTINRFYDILQSKNIIIYGAGKLGKALNLSLKALNLTPYAIWDKHADSISGFDDEVAIKVPQFDKEYPESIVFTALASDIPIPELSHWQYNLFGFQEISKAISLLSSINKYGIDVLKTKTDLLEKYFTSDINQHSIANFVAISTHNACNLSCKGCSEFNDIPHKKEQIKYKNEKVIEDLSTILSTADFICDLGIMGGEIFLHQELPDLLGNILAFPNIGLVKIATNGTIIPRNEKLLRLMQRPRVYVATSFYPNTISRERIQAFCQQLDTHHIHHIYTIDKHWYDFGGFEMRNYSPETLQQVYNSCPFKECNLLLDGQISRCARSVFATRFKEIPYYSEDYVNIRHSDGRDALRQQLKHLFEIPVILACQHCNGTQGAVIKAGMQSKRQA